jgi:ornithine decarboxylase
MDRDALREKYEEFQTAFPNAAIYYAVKANSDAAVIRFLTELGLGLEVGSEGSLRLLLELDVPPSRIISGNPLKSPAFIELAHSSGVRILTVDSIAEIDKLARLAPGCEVYVRISVPNNHSQWPLDKKFGVGPTKAVDLLIQAQEQGLLPIGITFHVGSQCTNPVAWTRALELAAETWQTVTGRGLEMSSLNLEGGFPVEYIEPVPSILDVAYAVEDAIQQYFPSGVEILLEPGRGLVAEAGVLVTTVIAKADRGCQNWLYLDVGVFNGLMESIGGIRYPMVTTKEGQKLNYVVAGPSCDSIDILPKEFELPELDIGDPVYIMSAGAYTTAYASQFDGIAIPKVFLT